MIKKFTIFLLCLGIYSVSYGQYSITGLTEQTIDFNTFEGAGFATAPTAGQLDLDDWIVTGVSDGDLTFGGTDGTTGDYAKGISAGGVTSGGVYSWDINGDGSDYVLGVQPTGSDFTPGSFVLRIQNNTGGPITSLAIAYDIYVLNAEGRANSYNFSHSANNVDFVSESSVDFTTPEAADAPAAWVANNQSLTITVNIEAGDFYYLQWTGSDVSGSGSRDEAGIDNISITASSDVAPEPTNQPTNFAADGEEFDTFSLSFTDAAAGTQEPAGYLLLVSSNAITDPTDNVAPASDSDLSDDGNAVIYIPFSGDNEVTFTGLPEGNTYNAKIYSYTNAGSNIDYKLTDVPSLTVSTTEKIYGIDFEGINTIYDVMNLSVHNISASNRWFKDSFSGDNFAEMTDFGGDGVEEDWMIIGPVNMDAYTDETFSFTSIANFVSGSPMSVQVSTDYAGDVASANWSTLSVTFSPGGFAETYSGLVDISAVNGQAYIAFVYEENETSGFEANGLYQIDDIKISGNKTAATVFVPSLSNASTDLFVGESITTTSDIVANDFAIADGEELVISAGNTVTVYGDVALVGSVTVQSGGSFIHYGEALEAGGSFTTSRSTTFGENAGQYSVMGGTTSGANTADLGTIIYRYNETTAYGADGLARFEAVAGQSMEPGIGYFTANTGNVTFSGIPNTGGYVVTVTNTGGTDSDGFNLVANPYTSGVDFDVMMDINNEVEGSIYIWDDGGSDQSRRTNADYITVNELGVASGGSGRATDWDGTIRSGQGFFVRVPSGPDAVNADFVFTNNMRVAGSNSDAGFFRQESTTVNDIVNLSINRGELSSNMLIGFRADATEGADRLYDAVKFSGNNDLQLFSVMGDRAYAIQGLPLLSGNERVINLGFDAGEAGTYSISADEIIIPAEYDLILIDKQLDLTVNLSDLGSYTFTTNVTENNRDRFAIAFRTSAVTSVDELTTDKLLVYTDADFVNVSLENGATIEQFTVYTLSGQILTSGTNDQESIRLRKGLFSEGVNILKAESGASSYTIKFILD